jgi:hypothetical protein
MSVSTVDQKTKILELLSKDPHRAFEAENLLTSIKPAAAKDPQQKQEVINEIKSDLTRLVEEGKVREVHDGVFKLRIFTNETKQIEHVFIGGMGNTYFRFKSPIFRLNIGVMAVFFIKGKPGSGWMILIRDSTAGTSYCFPRWLSNKVYHLGNREAAGEEEDFVPIIGRYVEEEHVKIGIQDDLIDIEDKKTLTGTRVDLLTEEGYIQYHKAVQDFMKNTDASRVWDPVTWGRYIMDQLLKNKINYEATFFGATVDSMVLQTSGLEHKSKTS